MIEKTEIDIKSDEFQIHASNVQRDYVFGWLLAGIYTNNNLADLLVLKGGSCLRKAYFENTRFSVDLDFSCEVDISKDMLSQEFDKVCDFVSDQTGIVFDKDQNRVEDKKRVDSSKKVYDVRLYFNDFYGKSSSIFISVRFDIMRFDKIYLPVQDRYLIHPYSDANKCHVLMKCVKLEEVLASKLKCLLQRRHSPDLYDYVYSIFFDQSVGVARSEIVQVFLKKTIYEPAPGVVKGLLLNLPFAIIKRLWNKYLVVPQQGKIVFENAVEKFKEHIFDLFDGLPSRLSIERRFFPSHLRNPIMEAASKTTLLKIVYDGRSRIVEPYSLSYKVRKDGVGQEYFYVWDRTGGRSAPGIKALLSPKLTVIENTDEKFEPRYPVELCKAGEIGGKRYFSRPFSRFRTQSSRRSTPRRTRRSRSSGTQLVYIIECPYCRKRFQRNRFDTRLNPHKDKYKNQCFGRIGVVVDQRYK